MKKIKITICAAAAILLISVIVLHCGETAYNVQSNKAANVLLIDPGHGGMDGGAVSSEGVMEKNINLAIAMELKQLAEGYGLQVVMTRETDQWLSSSEEGSIRSRKTEDLKKRCEIISESSPQMAVSIHLNSFKENATVKGAQVFYPDEGGDEDVLEKCRLFAEVLQKNISDKVEAEKSRTAMVRNGVFIFRDIKCPIVIVECGFLSNFEETQKLQTPEYQKRLAQGIMDGIVEFSGLERPSSVEIIDSLR